MSDSNLEPAGKLQNHKECGVYWGQDTFIEEISSSQTCAEKHITDTLHSSWEIWYQEGMVDEQPTLNVYAKHKGPIFTRKYKLTVAIWNKDHDNFEKSIDIEDVSEPYVVSLPKEKLKDGSVYFKAEPYPTHYISAEYITGNDFREEDRPHDVFLNIGCCTIYGHKVVLALWSDYFDRLFFSDPKTEHVKGFEIEDIQGDAVEDLLNFCLNRKLEFHNLEEEYSVDQMEAAQFLRMPVPLKFIKECKKFHLWAMEQDVMEALVLADKLSLPNLLTECKRVFELYDDDYKKRFLTHNEEILKTLSIGTLFRFINMTLSRDSAEELYQHILPDVKESEVNLEPFESGVNSRKDVCLLVGDERFEVHKEYLAFWSPFFDRLFFGDFIEKEMVEMEIKEVDPQEFATLLRLIYPPGDVRIDDSNVEYLLKLADRFQMKSILAMCCSYLARRVTGTESHELIMNTLNLADQYFLVDAQISCFEKIRKMSPEDSKKFRWDYGRDLAQLSENTKYNLVLSI